MSKLLNKFTAPWLTFCFVFFVSFAGQSSAQTATATLSGTVVDANGAAVPGATVSLTDTGKGFERKVTTGNDGSFILPLLQPSNYTLLVERDGFAASQVGNVILNVNDVRAMRVELKISPVKGEVIVTPDASLVSVSPEVSTSVDRTFVGNLPLSGRSFQSLILLTPGIVATPQGFESPGEFSVNGQRSNANYFTVDGVSANTGVGSTLSEGVGSNSLAGKLPGLGASGSTSTLVSVDALEEFKIQTSTYSAQFGRQPGAQVQLSTRSGTNDFRGTLFEYVRNEAFDARNYFNKEPTRKPPTRLNQFGGTFSGPLFLPRFGTGGPDWYNGKERTFFFFSFEAQRLRLPSNAVRRVPSLRIRRSATAQLKPVLNAFPLPTGEEILVSCDPNTAGCSANGTRPSGSAPFLASFSNPSSQDATSIRIDHRINGNHSVFGRFNYAPSDRLERNFAQLNGTEGDNRSLTIGLTSSLTSQISNEFRFNQTHSLSKGAGALDDFGGAVPIDVSVLLPGYTGELRNAQGRFTYSTSAGSSEIFIGAPFESRQRQYNIVDSLTWTKANHVLRFGFDYRRLAPIFGPLQYQQAGFAFLTDTSLEASFLGGNLFFINVDGRGSAVRPRFDNFSTYFQDSWQATRRLTLDLGLRWELNPTPSEADGRSPVFVAGAENLETARLLGPGEKWYKTDYSAFAPRFGAAYLLNQKAGRETVLRGGIGLYYDLNSGLATAAYGGFPFVLRKSVCCNVPWPITPEQAALPPQPSLAFPITSPLFALNEDLKLPYTLQWNFSVEQSLGKAQTVTAGYVASAGRRLTTRQRVNQQMNPLDPNSRPNMDFRDINYVSNLPSSDYHSMQVQYQRRLSKGFQALMNYTWSHSIDEVSNEVELGTLIRGNASFDVRHAFSGAFTYSLPRWKRYSVIDAIFRDWSFDAVILAYSGRPLDILINGSQVNVDGSFVTVRPDVIPGQPFWVEDGNAPGGKKINVAAFAQPPFETSPSFRYLRQGTLGRNVVRQPGIYQVNFSVRREFGFSERMKLQLRAEAFNLFNTPQLSGYSPFFSPGSTFFGRAESTLNAASPSSVGGLNALYALGGPRSMQFSARFSF